MCDTIWKSGNLEKYRRRVSWVVSQLRPPTNNFPSSWSSCLQNSFPTCFTLLQKTFDEEGKVFTFQNKPWLYLNSN